MLNGRGFPHLTGASKQHLSMGCTSRPFSKILIYDSLVIHTKAYIFCKNQLRRYEKEIIQTNNLTKIKKKQRNNSSCKVGFC